MNNLCKFSVPRGGAEKSENDKQKNRNADKGAHGLILRTLLDNRVYAQESGVLNRM